MMTGWQRWRWCGVRISVVTALSAGMVVPAWAQDHTRVLLLFDEDKTLPGLAALDQGFRSTLTTELKDQVEFFTESMNLSQFNDQHYADVLAAHYARKYRSRQPDLVVAVMGPSLTFLLRHGQDIFPGVPIVFCGADAADIQDVALPGHVTGVLVQRVFSPTLDIALRLQPETRHAFVIGGTSPFDRHLQDQARREFRLFESRVSIEYLTDLPMADLLKVVQRLPPKSIILYLSLFRDGAGQAFVPHDVSSELSAAANAPVYIFVDRYLGGGPVGGYLYSVARHGTVAAEVAARVLRGDTPSSIPTGQLSSSLNMFDGRQLERWGLVTRLLPEGSIVEFIEPSVWARYNLYIIGIAAILFAQAVLIISLLLQRSWRRRAEAELRASVDRIRDLGRRLLTAQEEERARIARELHDDVSQQLVILKMDLQALGSTVQDGDASLVSEDLQRTDDILASVHALSHRLHPTRLRLIGLVAALESLTSELSRPGVLVVFTHDDIPSPLPPDVTLCVFRIAQEALHNALKHSHARNISLHLRHDRRGLELTVVDNGHGFDAASISGKGLGLLSMRERAEVIGGTFEVQSSPHTGTTIELRVPLSTSRQPEHMAASGPEDHETPVMV
jgi:signal transduction histidine kinase